ncbi:MAG: toprim domain-containing protein [Methylococcales bacterium]
MQTNVIQQFTTALLDAGIQTNDHIIDDGALHRFHVIGDKKGTRNGAYILHNDCRPSGWFQHFSKGITGTWTANGKPRKLSAKEINQIQADRKIREIEQAKSYQQTALKARQIWQQSTPVHSHDYLTKKRVQAHNVRIFGNDLVIPLWNEQRAISTLQFIDSFGGKKFLTGGKKKDCFCPIGTPTDTILICEGFATGASLHQDGGLFVACAMDSGNLEGVARVIRRLFKSADIVICGDNDLNLVGQNAAKKAAIACGGSYIYPPIEGMDYNDYFNSMEG